MAYVIAEPCIGVKDTACVDACPVDCIHPRKDESDFASERELYINPVECIDCGACVPVCPPSAIFALAWTESVTMVGHSGVPDEVYELARRHFNEKELVDLTMAIIASNGWNRLAVSFRAVAGTYQPAQAPVSIER
jgi:NAD-dependent dihydropyrimidine dehydrogenase PreA subunit